MSLISWLRSKSAAEKLIAKALIDFEEGDQKDALGELIAGLRGFAAGTKADKVLSNIQTRLANFNMIPPPTLAPAIATSTPNATLPAAVVPASATATATK